jgi:predicted nucleotidyltransferase
MVNIYKPELTNLQQGILNLLFIYPTREFNMLRLSQNLEVSQPAIKKALPFLEKKNLIKVIKDKESKRYSITLNRDNSDVIHLKRSENLKIIYISGLVSFLFDSLPGSTIILFGSYSFGEDIETSDIDIAIVGLKEREKDLSKYEKILGREISLNFYNSFNEIKDTNLRNNLLNGVILSGSVKI